LHAAIAARHAAGETIAAEAKTNAAPGAVAD
jgi:hypothetical protein